MLRAALVALLFLLCGVHANGAGRAGSGAAASSPSQGLVWAQQWHYARRRLSVSLPDSHWNCHLDCNEIGNHNLGKCRFCCPSYCGLEVNNNLRSCERCCPRYCARGSRHYGSTYGEKLACRGCCPRYCLLPAHANKIACEGCCPHYCQTTANKSKKACDSSNPAPYNGRYMKSNFC